MSDYELRTITAGGALGEYLPDFKLLKIGPALSDIGALEFEYARSGASYALVAGEDPEVCCTYNGVEIDSGRFLLQDDEHDEVSEDSAYRKFVGRTAVAVWLEDAIVYPPTGSTTKAAPSTFTNATVGTIMATLILRAQTRGTSSLINYSSFTSSVDSNGAAWTKLLTIEYETGVGLLQVLQNLIEQGVVEARFDKRQLHLYNPGGIGADRTVQADPVVLRTGRDIKEAPQKRTTRDLANVVLMGGDDDVLTQRTDAGSLGVRRRRETFVSQGGVTDSGTLAIIGDTQLALRADPKVQKTIGLQFTAESPKPWSAYFNGDYVWADVSGALEKFRVRQIVLTLATTDDQADLAVVLNDKIAEREILLSKQVQGISGGATMGGGNSVPADNNQTTDTLAPAAPATPTLATVAYLDADGKTQAQISISWAAVTTNSDATACTDLAGYEVQVARTSGQWTPLGRVEAGVTIAYASPFSPGITAYARVRAFDTNANVGAWSSAASITTATDTTPPPVPSTPTIDVTTFPGTIRVIWDGLGSGGEVFTNALYNDFDRVEVHTSLVNGFTPTSATRIDNITSRLGGVSSFSSSPLGPTYIKLVSVDNLGNTSAASTQATGTTTRVGAADLSATIGGFNLLYNSGFDNISNYLADWTTTGTPSRETGTVYSGAAALKFTKTGGALQMVSGTGGRNQKTFAVGDKVTVSVKVRRTNASMAVRLNLSGTVDFGAVSMTAGTGVWERITTSYTIGTAGPYYPRVYSDDANNGDFYVDEIQMEYGDVVTAWTPRADEILPLTVTQSEIADLAVLSTKMSNGALTSTLVRNGDFEEGISNWVVTVGGTGTAVVRASTAGSAGYNEALLTNPSPGYPTNFAGLETAIAVPVNPGDVISIVCKAKTDSGTAVVYAHARFFPNADGSGTTTGSAVAMSGTTTGTTAEYGGQVTVPAGTRSMFIGVYNLGGVASALVVDDVRVGKVIMAAQIGADQVTAVKILANQVTAEKLLVANLGTNLVENGGFDQPSQVDGNFPSKWAGRTSNQPTLNATPFGLPKSPFSLEYGLAAGSVEYGVASFEFAVSPLKAYFTSFDYITNIASDAAAVTTTKAKALILIQWFDRELAPPYGPTGGTGTLWATGYLGNTTIATGALVGDSAWHNMATQVTPPAGAKWAVVYYGFQAATTGGTNYLSLDNVNVQEVQVSAAIGGGAIIASKMAADSVTAANAAIENLAVINAKINTVDAGKISTSTLTADITVSGRIATAMSGARVQMDSSGLKAYSGAGSFPRSDMTSAGFYHYNSGGTEDFGADSSGVRVTGTITGSTFQSSATGERLVIAAGQARLSFQTNAFATQASYVDQFLDYGSTGSTESRKTLELHSGYVDATGVAADDAFVYISSRKRVNGTGGTLAGDKRYVYIQADDVAMMTGSTAYFDRLKMAPSYARAQAGGAQSIGNSAWTVVTMDGTFVQQSGGGYTQGGGGITVPRKGLYQINCTICWAPSATGVRFCKITVDGVIQPGRTSMQAHGSFSNSVHHSIALYLQAGEVVRVLGYQNSGANLNTAASNEEEVSFLSIALITEDI